MHCIKHLNKEIAPENRVLFKKLTGPKVVQKFPSFYGTQCSSLHVKQLIIGPCPDLDESSPYFPKQSH